MVGKCRNSPVVTQRPSLSRERLCRRIVTIDPSLCSQRLFGSASGWFTFCFVFTPALHHTMGRDVMVLMKKFPQLMFSALAAGRRKRRFRRCFAANSNKGSTFSVILNKSHLTTSSLSPPTSISRQASRSQYSVTSQLLFSRDESREALLHL